MRLTSIVGDQYAQHVDDDDPRFAVAVAPVASIATSHGQNDGGVFELDFRDARYLPFEGAGAISRWQIEMPPETNAFDLDSLSDVVLQLRYSARDGGEILRRAASAALKADLADVQDAPRARLFSLKHEFPTRWYRFVHPTDPATLELDLTRERFPYQLRGRVLTVDDLLVFLKPKGDGSTINLALSVGTKAIADLDNPKAIPNPVGNVTLDAGTTLGTLLVGALHDLSVSVPLTVVVGAAAKDIAKLVQGDILDDIWIVCRYSIA